MYQLNRCQSTGHKARKYGRLNISVETFRREMDCYLFVVLSFHGLIFSCTASRDHGGKRGHTSHVVHSTQPEKKQLLQHKKEHQLYHSPLHKKEEMLGQDAMRINDIEFKLQSLVSPEFHQGRKALTSGKMLGNMEVNTLSPEQVDFVQSTSQWPKFYDPQAKGKTPSRTIYPEDPVLFPREKANMNSNYNDYNNWNIGSDIFKQGMSPYSDDMQISSMLSMPTGSSSLGNEIFEGGHQKSNTMFEEKPGYMINQIPPVDDKMPSLSDSLKLNDDINKLSLSAKNIMGLEGPSKDSISALLGASGMRGRGKPVGILGNILKASQAMPTGRIIKPSTRSETWLNDVPFSRRQNLERSKYIAPAAVRSGSSSFKHVIKKHKQISKVIQKPTKKNLSKKSKL